jgi:hypothetical protein
MTQQEQIETMMFFIDELKALYSGKFDLTDLDAFITGQHVVGKERRAELMIKFDRDFVNNMSYFYTKTGFIRKAVRPGLIKMIDEAFKPRVK